MNLERTFKQRNATTPPRQMACRGFSLIEVLVVAAILGIALLGLLAMQTATLKFNKMAYHYTQAAVLAYDMVERMRANSSGTLGGYYNDLNDAPEPNTPSRSCTTTPCSPQEIASADLFQWSHLLEERLPSGIGSIIRADDKPTFVVRVMWDAFNKGVTGLGCNPENENDLQCIDITFQP